MTIKDQRELDPATLPVIVPVTAERAVDLAVQTNGDSFSATYAHASFDYEIYGTRAFLETQNKAQGGAPGITFFELEYGIGANFSLFGGASYRLIRFCEDNLYGENDPCWDQSTLKNEIERLTVTLGETARGRP